jgi:hypothetical protein
MRPGLTVAALKQLDMYNRNQEEDDVVTMTRETLTSNVFFTLLG